MRCVRTDFVITRPNKIQNDLLDDYAALNINFIY